eukprot:gnl/Trimastix_PCT/2861.p1 GENE.gnl/Trimastix_PCT/2861~~gnl/Trimastix_PCT/2861.p1  ORF type:complete len:220 (+),score=47.06 gnl/Trimastix_PCT/2861:41-661(+)
MGDRRQKQLSETVRLSKRLSYVLRHGAECEGIPISSQGWVRVDVLLRHRIFQGLTVERLHEIVESNDKKRFALETRDGCLCVRANQGHSMRALEVEMERVTSAEEIPIVVHGTNKGAWDTIKTAGLNRMGRQHIHFAVGLPGDGNVISGMRRGCEVLIYIDAAHAMADGIEFFRSANNVILSPGLDGVIAPRYFRSVVDSRGASLL